MGNRKKKTAAKFGVAILNNKDTRAKMVLMRNVSLIFERMRICVQFLRSGHPGTKPDRMVPQQCLCD